MAPKARTLISALALWSVCVSATPVQEPPHQLVLDHDTATTAGDNLYLNPSLSDPEEEEEAPTLEDEQFSLPSWFESTLLARRLLALSPTGTASTIFPSPLPKHSRTPGEVAGHSISLTEYVSDCESALTHPGGEGEREGERDYGHGNPIFLALNIATTFRNTASGSNLSLSLNWWDHLNATRPIFPGFPLSAAGLPRVTLLGDIEVLDFGEFDEGAEGRVRECYLSVHPDAEAWLPHRRGSPHASFWARLNVRQVYWVGGFGGVQRIGWVNTSVYSGVNFWDDGGFGHHGDHGEWDTRGWGAVRLPGESD